MENAWQYAKVRLSSSTALEREVPHLKRNRGDYALGVMCLQVYKQHVDPVTGEPTAEYWQWAKEGWANPAPVRFPMGRGESQIMHSRKDIS
jgi:hypothetical protein